MRPILKLVLLSLPLLPLAAQQNDAAPARERVYIGMVADEHDAAGVLVRAVAPGSPASKGGILAGDVLVRVGDRAVGSRNDLRQVVAQGSQGDALDIEVLRDGRKISRRVVLALRPDSPLRHTQAKSGLGADRHIQPIALPEAIRQEIRRHRRLVREQLASLPDGMEPMFVIRQLQAIRDLARDAHVSRPGWMSGRAGEISVRFRDEEGSVVLYGANNLLSLELYDMQGQLQARYELNSAAERNALPESVLQRLRRFR